MENLQKIHFYISECYPPLKSDDVTLNITIFKADILYKQVTKHVHSIGILVGSLFWPQGFQLTMTNSLILSYKWDKTGRAQFSQYQFNDS
jgi:hypothetical protein